MHVCSRYKGLDIWFGQFRVQKDLQGVHQKGTQEDDISNERQGFYHLKTSVAHVRT